VTVARGPRVVAIGGGHGLSISLRAVRRYAGEVTAVVTVADDGGSSGRLRSGLGIHPPGDIRRCLLALVPRRSIWAELFDYRFSESDVEGHSLGNLLLAALADLEGDFEEGVSAAARLLGAEGRVIPVAREPLRLSAQVGGRPVEGQAEISKARGDIESMTLKPEGATGSPRALAAIADADQIVIGPGSLYTSVVAALMVPGVADAVNASPASKAFVLNLVTQDGETLGLDGSAHLRALSALAGIEGPGAIVGHRGPLRVPPGLQRLEAPADGSGWIPVEADLNDPEGDWPAHDPEKLGPILQSLV